jgi:hypothetical protein
VATASAPFLFDGVQSMIDLSARPTVVVGGGPALVGFDFNRLRPFNVVAVKGCIFDIPWARCGYGLDMPRFFEWKERLCTEVTMPVFWSVPVEGDPRLWPKPPHIHYVHRLSGVGFSRDWRENYGGGSSGFGALGLSVALRAGMAGKPVCLLGFEYRGDGRGGVPIHHNPAHYKKRRYQNDNNWLKWAEHFSVLAPRFTGLGVDVINASATSAITAFPRMPLEDALAYMTARL